MTIKNILNITTFLDINKRYYSPKLFDRFFKDYNIDREANKILISGYDISIFVAIDGDKIIDYELVS